MADDADRDAGTGAAPGIAHRAVPRVERGRFIGADGERRFPVVGRFEVPEPGRFRAEYAHVQFGRLALRRTTMTAHRMIIDGRLSASDSDGMLLMVVQQGTMTASPRRGAPFRLGVGEAVFIGRARQFAFHTDDEVTLVVSALPEESLPAGVRRLGELPPGPLPDVPLVSAVVRLLTGLASRLDEPMAFDAGYAERGLIDLETAILLELLGGRRDASRADLLYEAAVEYIDRHIAEPALAPPMIAQALGVSLRSLHGAFSGRDVTVTRHLRDRRLDLVAEVVRASSRRPSSASLAARFGYAGPAPLTRAFRQRFGRSIVEYRREGPSARRDLTVR
jgi:AraC-like DNA-binding protein